MKISFRGQDDVERQVKQVMRENYTSMEDEVLKNCRAKIDKEFRGDFAHKMQTQRSEIGNQDAVNMLTILKDAYKGAGMQQDAQALSAQISRLDVKG